MNGLGSRLRALALVPLLLAAATTSAVAGPGAALTLGPVTVHGDQASRLQVGAGAFDFNDDDAAPVLNLEYRFGRKLFVVGPALGILANTDGGVFGYGGAYADVAWGSVHLTPVLSLGGYREGGGKDLGGMLQFRQSIDLTWEFENRIRIGLRLAHISNAGLDDDNPGANDLQLGVSMPFAF